MTKQNFTFIEGETFCQNNQVFLMPINSYLLFYNYLFKKYTTQELQFILLECSQKNAYTYYLNSKNNLSFELNLKSYLEYLNKHGFCFSRLIRHNKNETIISIENTALSKYYKKLIKKEPEFPLEYIYSTFVNNYLSFYYNKQFLTSYVIKNNQIYFNFKKTNLEVKIPKQFKMQFKNKSNTYNSIIKNILVNNLLKYKNNLLYIWKLCGIAVPYTFLIELFSKINDEKFIESLGRNQGRSASKLQNKLFGLNSGYSLAKSVISQSELLGGGIIIIKKEKPFQFIIKNSLEIKFNHIYTKKELEAIKIYFYNLVRGAYEESMLYSTNIKIENDVVTLVKNQNKLDYPEELKLMVELKNIIE